jgi:hypothetical protein
VGVVEGLSQPLDDDVLLIARVAPFGSVEFRARSSGSVCC